MLHEDTPTLPPRAALKLIAMRDKPDASFQDEFGLPLGLVVVTHSRPAQAAREPARDAAVDAAITLLAVAWPACFVLGVAHFGKSLEKGIRGNSSREDAGDLVLACLGDRTVSGTVSNTRLAIRKHKSGPQGQEYPFTMRTVAAPELDEDGEPITTNVVDVLPV